MSDSIENAASGQPRPSKGSNAKGSKKARAPEAPKVTVKVATRYAVAPGRSLTTRRGILGPGASVDPARLNGGEETLRAFLKSGHIVKVS